ncbi:hypothetical protein NEF87_003429 [Candidatus Lokiarchaeum ossiferum]|uniref:Uncharacterized protein n=1 Tax=Candidatus Lokiarchaeum ossiferum TaxID=2951803 RepID=A0ABY6HXG4_9ARCH|nr:hypothetical protein NEF87_003429 [Candidatus Lokiarchaeum sp. B-35]
MVNNVKITQEIKIQLAKTCFNETWDYIEKLDKLKPWEKEMMIAAAHTSRFFWGQVGKPINYQRGEWILTHVYSLLKRGEPALHHAKECWNLTEKENIKDFDLAFAHEGLARAYALNKDVENAKIEYLLAKEAAKSIKNTEDKDYFMEELEKGPWFGFEKDS